MASVPDKHTLLMATPTSICRYADISVELYTMSAAVQAFLYKVMDGSINDKIGQQNSILFHTDNGQKTEISP